MCSHSAPDLIMRWTSAESLPKSEESTEGEMMGEGIFREAEGVVGGFELGGCCGSSFALPSG